MEYCSGGELFQYLVDHGRLVDPMCRQMFSAIVDAVSYLHARGIAHRDLKPENILFTDHFSPKIADLGLCHLVTSDSLMQTPCGSPHYAAPEVLLCKGYDGRASDVWSLGVVLFVMATAKLPWRSTTNADLFREIGEGEFTVPAFLSPPLKALIRRMMNPRAGERPTIAEIASDPYLMSDGDDILGLAAIGAAKTMSMDLGCFHTTARRPEATMSGKAVIMRPSGFSAMYANPAKKGQGQTDALLRKGPRAMRATPPRLQKIPIRCGE
jgi:serine/threonine protein kinase